MHQYKLFPYPLKFFFNVADYFSYLLGKNLEIWNGGRIETCQLLNNEGQILFQKMNINLDKYSTIFYTPKHTESMIHFDGLDPNMARINFILKGGGKMIWYELPNAQSEPTYLPYPAGDNRNHYYKFKSINEKKIIDIWDNKENECAMVNVITPHNIITENTDRLVLSIRTTESFANLCHLLETYNDSISTSTYC